MIRPSNLGEFLGADSAWEMSEQWVIKWQYQLLGDFQAALAGAIACADESNLARLALGFPDQVQGFLAWSRGDLGHRLRKSGLEI